MGNSEDIIFAIDEKLISTGKPYINLGDANKLLLQKQLLSITEKNKGKLKEALEKNLIPHAYQTKSSPKQWRIPISENKKYEQKQIKVARQKIKIKNQEDAGLRFTLFQKISGVAVILILIVLIYQYSVSNYKLEIKNNELDSSVSQVELFLKTKYLNDPGSYESIEWSKVIKVNENEWRVRHKYRAKNIYGSYEIENTIFSLDSTGNVTRTFTVN